MNLRVVISAAVVTLCLASPAQSRDDRLRFPIKDALEHPDAKAQLDPNIRFLFGSQAFPEPTKRFGQFTSNKKTNFFNKSDKEGCERAFLSALLSFQDRVRREGGNAVVNLKSVYRNGDFSSDTEYECGAGNVTGGVALRGEVVTLP